MAYTPLPPSATQAPNHPLLWWFGPKVHLLEQGGGPCLMWRWRQKRGPCIWLRQGPGRFNCCEIDPDLNLAQRKTQKHHKTMLNNKTNHHQYPEPITDHPSPHDNEIHNPSIKPDYPPSGIESNLNLVTLRTHCLKPNLIQPCNSPHWTQLLAAWSWPPQLIKLDRTSPKSHLVWVKTTFEQELLTIRECPWPRKAQAYVT